MLVDTKAKLEGTMNLAMYKCVLSPGASLAQLPLNRDECKNCSRSILRHLRLRFFKLELDLARCVTLGIHFR